MPKNIQLGHTIAILLSIIIPGMGQIYRRKILKGLVLILSFVIAIGIIWFAFSNKEFKMFDWYGKKVMFNPAMKTIKLGNEPLRVIDLMKITGSIQLVITWIYALIDVWKDDD